jgi:chromate transporter
MGRVLRVDQGAGGRPEGSVGEVARVFLRLGLIGFGGPLVHVALMRDEIVRRRGWIDDATFLDLVAATNLLPGPNSTELAIHLGLRRAGRPGILAAGLAFIVPPALIVLALAWLYVTYGSTPPAQALLAGIKPVVIGIVVVALAGLARRVAGRPAYFALATVAGAVYVLGVDELAILAAGALAGLALGLLEGRTVGRALAIAAVAPATAWGAAAAASTLPITLGGIFAVFLKIGALLFGSGYVLLAFLRADLVLRLGWLSDRQLLDAVSAGQVTPGPLFTTATFVGYLLAGPAGALVATVAIFLPAFCFASLLGPIVRGLRSRPWAANGLDGLTASSLGLMGGVALLLGREALAPTGMLDLVWIGLAVVAAAAMASGRLGATALIAIGGLVGVLRALVG